MRAPFVSVLFLAVYFVSFYTYGQSQRKYPVDLPAHDLSPVPGHSIRARIIGYNVFEYTIQKDDDPEIKEVFTVQPNDLSSFESSFRVAFDSVLSKDSKKTDAVRGQYKQAFEAVNKRAIFYFFKGGDVVLESVDTKPIAGEIFFRDKVHPQLISTGKSSIRRRLRYAKPEPDSQVDNLKEISDIAPELIGLIKKLDSLKRKVDRLKLAPARDYYTKQVTKETKKIDSLLQGLNGDNYKVRREVITKRFTQFIDPLIREINALVREVTDVDVTYTRKGLLRRKRYTIRTIERDHYEKKRHEAKRILKDALYKIQVSAHRKEFEIKRVEIEFNESFIENIEVIAALKDTILKFENNYAIGFATKRDYNFIQYNHLFASYNQRTYTIPLNEVIDRYEQKHAVNRRDYSPANQVIDLDFATDPKRSMMLEKETTAKLFELKTYSDFVGFDQQNPNGLIQFEIDKRINIRTGRFKIPRAIRINGGIMQFITPTVVKSKIEENNKFLLLNYRNQFTNNQYTPSKFTSTLELRRYENFSTGADLNIFLLDMPSSKSTIYLNAGFRYGRVDVRDSLQEFSNNEVKRTGFARDFGVNTFTVSPVKLSWELMTDERYTFTIGGSLNWYYLRDNYFRQVSNIQTYADVGKVGNARYLYKNFFMLVCFRPQSDASGRLFFRYQYNWQQSFWRTGFHQAQVGYSVYLTKQLKPN